MRRLLILLCVATTGCVYADYDVTPRSVSSGVDVNLGVVRFRSSNLTSKVESSYPERPQSLPSWWVWYYQQQPVLFPGALAR